VFRDPLHRFVDRAREAGLGERLVTVARGDTVSLG
jgi:hypothetical protein